MRGVYERVRGSGIWWVCWFDHAGRRHREKAGTRGMAETLYHKRKQQSLERKKLPELRRNQSVPISEIVADCMEWSKANKRSWKEDEYRAGKILTYFGNASASEITSGDIERYLISLRRKGSAAAVNRARSLLSLVFRLAEQSGKVSGNPVSKTRRMKEPPGRIRFLTPDEELRLRLSINPRNIPELDIALNTGMRQGEQYGLRWTDVDLERGLINIPLSKHGDRRSVALNSTAIDALRALACNKTPSGRVFRIKSPREWFKNACLRAGLTDFRWHDLRHTAASRAVMAGVPLRAVQELLGHKSIMMTIRYAHLSPGYQREVAEKLGEANLKIKGR